MQFERFPSLWQSLAGGVSRALVLSSSLSAWLIVVQGEDLHLNELN